MIRRRSAVRPYKLLSVLLRYPDERLVQGCDELRAAIAVLPSSTAAPLARFVEHVERHTALELAQAYVETFDLRRRGSLYLTYFRYGDTRKRGMALLRLKRLYTAAGLELEGGELPDYLPLMLEFASLAPDEAGEELFREHRPGLELLRAGLHDAESPYADVLDALSACLPRLTPLERERIRALAAEGPPSEQVGLQPFAPPEVVPGARV
ncbi:MAG TPA: nitrate reductase molybdenum cofactor assembly chaperone [Gaiellaceae bacterium]